MGLQNYTIGKAISPFLSDQFPNIIITGDMNLPDIDWNTYIQ